MEDNRLWFLIARHLSGEINADESGELQELLKTHPDKYHLFDILHSYFVLPGDLQEGESDSSMDDEQRFRRIIEQGEPEPERSRLPGMEPGIKRDPYRVWRYAAAAACIAVLAGLSFNYFRQPKTKIENTEPKGNEIISRSGARTKLLLPDGSQV